MTTDTTRDTVPMFTGKRVSNYKEFQNQGNYYRHSRTGGTESFEHRDVWKRHNGPIPEGHVVHHIDGNPSNNAVENLQCLSIRDHRRIHSGWVWGNGDWQAKPCATCGEIKPLDGFYVRGGCAPTGSCKACMHSRLQQDRALNPERHRGYDKKRRSDPSNREKEREMARRYWSIEENRLRRNARRLELYHEKRSASKNGGEAA